MTPDELQNLPELPQPRHPLIMRAGQSMTLQVTHWEEGKYTIHPADEPAGVEVHALRLFGPRVDKPSHVAYHDVDQDRLIAQIRPFLESPAHVGATLTLKAQGFGARLNFEVTVTPPGRRPLAERIA